MPKPLSERTTLLDICIMMTEEMQRITALEDKASAEEVQFLNGAQGNLGDFLAHIEQQMVERFDGRTQYDYSRPGVTPSGNEVEASAHEGKER
jgi:hypothetical protein